MPITKSFSWQWRGRSRGPICRTRRASLSCARPSPTDRTPSSRAVAAMGWRTTKCLRRRASVCPRGSCVGHMAPAFTPHPRSACPSRSARLPAERAGDLSVRRVEPMRRQAAYRARRADLALHQTMYQIRSDEMAHDQGRMSARFSAQDQGPLRGHRPGARKSALGLLVIRLREAGLSLQAVQTAIETEIHRGERAHGSDPAAGADASAHGRAHCLGQPRSRCRGRGRPGLSSA